MLTFAIVVLPLLAPSLDIKHTADSIDQVKKQVDAGNAMLLDVREPSETNKRRLAAATLLPLSQMKTDEALNSKVKDWKKSVVIYCHCASGVRCLKAAEKLKSLGFDARPLKESFGDLVEAGFELAGDSNGKSDERKAKSPVVLAEGDDPKLNAAYAEARKTFRYFWREVAHDSRRIVKALDLAIVKAAFSDDPSKKSSDGTPSVEHMWLAEIDFDGKEITGVLQNDPHGLKSVKKGQRISLPLAKIEDWMYVVDDEVYGAYTVHALRESMNVAERREHDNAWGYKFGDPKKVRVGPPAKAFKGKNPIDASEEHPMDERMATSLRTQLKRQPKLASEKTPQGWTLLHQEALAGNAHSVKALLEAGADPKAKTKGGLTARDLAKSLGWKKVLEVLKETE